MIQIFMRKYFVVQHHPRNIFNIELFPNYGIGFFVVKSTCFKHLPSFPEKLSQSPVIIRFEILYNVMYKHIVTKVHLKVLWFLSNPWKTWNFSLQTKSKIQYTPDKKTDTYGIADNFCGNKIVKICVYIIFKYFWKWANFWKF